MKPGLCVKPGFGAVKAARTLRPSLKKHGGEVEATGLAGSFFRMPAFSRERQVQPNDTGAVVKNVVTLSPFGHDPIQPDTTSKHA
jgi:hypothetical protein